METLQSNTELIRLETQIGELVRIVAHLNNHVNRLEKQIEIHQGFIDKIMLEQIKV